MHPTIWVLLFRPQTFGSPRFPLKSKPSLGLWLSIGLTPWTSYSGEDLSCLSLLTGVCCAKSRERVNYIFLHCSYSRFVWYYFLDNLNIPWVMLRNLVDLFALWSESGMGVKGKCFWKCLSHAVVWNLWR